MFVRALPSTAGNLADPSSCTILFAVVPTSTFSVAEPEVAPPVKPVPATTAVISPAPVLDGAQYEFALSHASTCPSVGAAVCTFDKALNCAALIRPSALAFVKYKFVPSAKFVVDLVASLLSNVVLKSAVASFVAIEFVIVVEKFASSPSAAANSFNVSNAPGAESTSVSIFACALASALASV